MLRISHRIKITTRKAGDTSGFSQVLEIVASYEMILSVRELGASICLKKRNLARKMANFCQIFKICSQFKRALPVNGY